MEVRLLFALGLEASIVCREGESPQPAWCQGHGASREPGPVSAQAVLWVGAWPGHRSAQLSPLPARDLSSHPSLPHSPLCLSLPSGCSAVTLGVLPGQAEPGYWPALGLSVCLSVCLIVHWLFQMAHSPVLALLQDHASTGCQWLMLPSAHKGVNSYAEFWTGEGWGAKQQPSSSSAPAGFARGALLPSPYLLLQMTSCSQSSAAKPVQKLGLPLGTSVFLMEILHLNARSPWVSPRGNWEPGMTLSMPCSHCVWSLSWPEEWSR